MIAAHVAENIVQIVTYLSPTPRELLHAFFAALAIEAVIVGGRHGRRRRPHRT